MVGANDNDGLDTLHGGFIGWDLRIWSLVDQKMNSLTFGLTDPSGTEGFPATAKATVTYTLENDGKWNISMQATADGVTPMMLSQHTYFVSIFRESGLPERITSDAPQCITITTESRGL